MMGKMSLFQKVYLVILIVVLFVVSASTTYAYWAAKASSTEEALKTESTIYSINMEILPLYNDFSFIPMNDVDAVKALGNGCKDKYGRGACAAYKMRVFGYSQNLAYISGYMDVTTNNMVNLSYMVYRESETYEEGKCVNIENKNYCAVYNATPIGEGVNLSLGDRYDVYGLESAEFIILLWLTNLDTSQNEFDIGSFNAIVTMQAGSGGEIKGSISSAIIVDDSNDDTSVDDNKDSTDDTNSEDTSGNTEG